MAIPLGSNFQSLSSDIDTKVIKTFYPKNNNDNTLEIIFDKDPNLCLKKNSLKIHFKIAIDDKYIPDTLFVAKLFKMLSIEIDNQIITSNKTPSEYYYNDLINKLGNFNIDYLFTYFGIEGYSDLMSVPYSKLSSLNKVVAIRKSMGFLHSGIRTYEIIFTPTNSFILNNDPFPPGFELKLNFERSLAKSSLIIDGSASPSPDLTGKTIELLDCYAIGEYVSSHELRSYFKTIEHKPISYYIENCEIIHRTLPTGELSIRIPSVRSGNAPMYFFCGIVKSSNIEGDFQTSSTQFNVNNVTELVVCLNGIPLQSQPSRIDNDMPVWIYRTFYEVTNRDNNYSSRQLKLTDFLETCIYAVGFDGCDCSSGNIDVNIQLHTAYTDPHTLVTFSIMKEVVELYKDHRIERRLL